VIAIRPAVSICRVHAEPASEHAASSAIVEVAWLALWPDGSVSYHRSALALLRTVRQRDRRAAARADRNGHLAMLVTLITWNDTPPGFVPPTEDVSWTI
jgi:hypothetical protein